jgi:hypothetical protein
VYNDRCPDLILRNVLSLLQSQTLNPSQMVTQCVAAMASCQVPLGQIYNWPSLDAPATVYANDQYNPLLGPFAINAWGLRTLLSNIELFTCQGSCNYDHFFHSRSNNFCKLHG